MEEQYLELMAKVWETGEHRTDRTGVGTRSLFGEQISFDLTERFPLLTTKRVFFRGVIEELLWFIAGRTDVAYLTERDVHIWDQWATAEQCGRFGREAGDLGPVYGHQWRNFGGTEVLDDRLTVQTWYPDGVDQVQQLVDELQNNPASRRLIVTGWNPAEADKVTLPPCHTLWQCYVHEDGRLDLQLYQRSADLFLGVPFNIASYALLVHLLAKHCDLLPGRLVMSYGDVHLYQNHADQVVEQLGRTPNPMSDRPLLRVAEGVDIFTATARDVQLIGYTPQAPIPAPVAV